MTTMTTQEPRLQSFDYRCKKLLELEKIRFAGIIDEDGNKISGGFKQGLQPLESDQEKLNSFMQFVSQASLRKNFDLSLGPINYLAARRDKAVLISFPFPVSRILLLISAEPSINIEELALQVTKIFEGSN